MKNILVIGKSFRPARRVATEIIKLGFNAVIINPKNIVGFNRSSKTISVAAGRLKKSIKIPIDSISGIVPYCGHPMIQYLTDVLNIPTTNTYEAINLTGNKYRSSIKLASNGVYTPKEALIAGKRTNVKEVFDELKYPLILKTARGSQGSGVYLVENEADAIDLSDRLLDKVGSYIAQEFVKTESAENKPHDYRLFVVDGKVVATMKRIATTGIKTNHSIHKNSEKVEASSHMKSIALSGMQSLGLKIGGIDLAKNSDSGRWMTYEGNSCPGFGIERITGINVAKKIAQYATDISKVVVESLPNGLHLPELTEMKLSSKIDKEEYGSDEFKLYQKDYIKLGAFPNMEALKNVISDANDNYM